jgi:hypothetical protein
MAIHYAIYLPLFDPFGHPRVIAELAREAEQAGWDGVFTWDDVAGWEQDMADPTVALAAAALATERVRLGALITPLARRRPWKFARERVQRWINSAMAALSSGRGWAAARSSLATWATNLTSAHAAPCWMRPWR